MKNLTDSVREMVRRDIVRGANTLAGQRPGQPIEDGRKCWVRIPISVESWIQGYRGAEPPVKYVRQPPDPLAGAVVIQAFLQYHLGKRAWELSYWAVVDEHGEALSEPSYAAWGVGDVAWKDV